jgi:hypothetical protein
MINIIDISQATIIKDTKKKRVFKIKTAKTKITLKTDTEKEREMWL